MANPTGRNNFGTSPSVFTPEQPKGAKQEAERLQRSAVMAGARGAASALDTPRRAKRKASRGQREGRAVQPQPGTEPIVTAPAGPTSPVPELPYPDRVFAVWNEIASEPDASPLVLEYAERAARLAGK